MIIKCTKCSIEYTNNGVSKKLIESEPEKYLNFCKDCRKIKKCGGCGKEFKHHQNKTCSKECSKNMKEKTAIKNYGEPHNFSRESRSRKEWQSRLLEEEGISNVFQRDSIKNKLKETWNRNYGVDNPSKSELIKIRKSKTLKETLRKNPNLYKENWKAAHQNFIDELGYDPRLHAIGKASKESLIIFEPLIRWCLSEGIDYDDIYLGVDGKREYFIQTNKKIYFYDFCIRSKKIIIEFHGTSFHANPNDENVNEWRHPFTGETAKINLHNTNIKNKKAIQKGFSLIEIWSNEDPNTNLEICKKFIKNNIYEN